MNAIRLGRGSVVVEGPDPDPGGELMSGLRRFRHERDGSGEYEDLFTFNSRRGILVTLPGFADRVVKLCPGYRVKDERIPLPEPDLEAATSSIDEVWHKVVSGSIKAGGGVVSIPDVLGYAAFAAAILRAYPRGNMLDRGTPISIVAAKDTDTARSLGMAIRELLPGREVGIGPRTDSDDVVVVAYGNLDQVPRHAAGVFIGTDAGADPTRRAENISSIRNAARWGVVSTAGGGEMSVDIGIEGLFGPLSAHASYSDAVKAGVGVPVTVCWLQCPQPFAPQVSADEQTMEKIVMLENPRFMDTALGIMREVSGDTGCLLVGSAEVVAHMARKVPGVSLVHKKIGAGARHAILDDLASGTVRKAFLSRGYYPEESGHGVMIAATLGGTDAAEWFPWHKPMRQGDRVYVVDFTHEWDVHNGRPGRLARNDEARKRRYAETGFSQIRVGDINELPFM